MITPEIRRVGLTTGGGDAPGLNAVIRAAVVAGLNHGWEMLGIRRGFDGLLGDGDVIVMDRESVRGITHVGGTILGTTNRGNPFSWPVEKEDGTVERVDRSAELIASIDRLGIDALIAIGGDGTLHIAERLCGLGVPIVGVPKTIDNDLAATSVTFGFHTAVQTATEALDRLHSTAQSHERVMVVEVMGRDAGWIALYSGVSSTADVILIPEIPFDIESVCNTVNDRWAAGPSFAIVVAAEGAHAAGGEIHTVEGGRYGGIAEVLAAEIGERTGHETRSLALGHLQRGGTPTAYDRLIALRFGAAAVRLVREGRFGHMVALDPPNVRGVPIDHAIRELKRVPVDGDIVQTARALGIGFGD
ncbi:MAG: ATP-dependent 6-phosphofructokinase [Gemmatimonadota bacterium]